MSVACKNKGNAPTIIDEKECKKQEFLRVLRSCNVPSLFLDKSLKDYGDDGRALRAYLLSPGFANDASKGKGRVLYGENIERINIFNIFSKELILAGYQTTQTHYSAYFISLRGLATLMTIAHENELVSYIEQAKTLCISYFYDVSQESPYSLYERSLVEDLLRRKIDKGHKLYLSSSSSTDAMGWWSRDLRRLLQQVCEEVQIGQSSRRSATMRFEEA